MCTECCCRCFVNGIKGLQCFPEYAPDTVVTNEPGGEERTSSFHTSWFHEEARESLLSIIFNSWE